MNGARVLVTVRPIAAIGADGVLEVLNNDEYDRDFADVVLNLVA